MNKKDISDSSAMNALGVVLIVMVLLMAGLAGLLLILRLYSRRRQERDDNIERFGMLGKEKLPDEENQKSKHILKKGSRWYRWFSSLRASRTRGSQAIPEIRITFPEDEDDCDNLKAGQPCHHELVYGSYSSYNTNSKRLSKPPRCVVVQISESGAAYVKDIDDGH
ncbi:hypothetical protein V1511DRAFT_486180 [Dipodascopsis uninucleata]